MHLALADDLVQAARARARCKFNGGEIKMRGAGIIRVSPGMHSTSAVSYNASAAEEEEEEEEESRAFEAAERDGTEMRW